VSVSLRGLLARALPPVSPTLPEDDRKHRERTHRVNRPTPGVPRVEDFHPNAAGYVASADAIATKLPNGRLDKKQLV
jgi:lysophospholipase L1-like esterase